ncbi:MAG: Hint domain-containing protein [Albidovulum sp.]|uniref:Hint domain-containing protein n=1 Tax=Albidovulum sp. TaxID=1872424 RepID=UPI003C89D52A
MTNNDTVIIDIPGGGDVTIVADPSVKVKKCAVRFVDDTEADTVRIDLHTFSETNLHIDIWDYDPSDTVQLLGGFNKQVDPQHPDLFDFNYVGSTGATFNGMVRARDKGENDFNAQPQPVIICFAKDSLIDTDLGPRPVETIREGDLVVTQENGLQPVRWIGRRSLDSLDLARHPQLLPVRIAAGGAGGRSAFP